MGLKKVIALIIGLLMLVSLASAYYVNIVVPDKVSLGEDIVVTGESNLPAGHRTTIIFASSGLFSKVIEEREIVIQAGGNFSAVFKTNGLSRGNYKVEIRESGQYTYGSSSKTWRIFEIVDRTDELKVTSPKTQEYDGTLEIAGTLEKAGDEGIEMTITKGDETVFGPVYIATKSGAFSESVTIGSAGMYSVALRDRTGYRWSFDVVVATTETPTPVTTTTAPTTVATPAMVTVTGRASRAEPAYFEISALPGNVTVTTSGGVDWVLECIDEQGRRVSANTRGTAPERLELTSSGGKIYLKVYPDQFGASPNVTINVENAASARGCPECASRFGAEATATQTTPFPIAVVLIALFLVLMHRRGR